MSTRGHTEVELAARLGLPTVAALNAAIRTGRVPAPDIRLPSAGRIWYVPDDLAAWLRGEKQDDLAARAREVA